MSEETLLDRYFAENLQMVCAPGRFPEPDPPVMNNNTQATTPSENDPAPWIAAWTKNP